MLSYRKRGSVDALPRLFVRRVAPSNIHTNERNVIKNE